MFTDLYFYNSIETLGSLGVIILSVIKIIFFIIQCFIILYIIFNFIFLGSNVSKSIKTIKIKFIKHIKKLLKNVIK